MVMAGIGPHCTALAARMAAPVGVVELAGDGQAVGGRPGEQGDDGRDGYGQFAMGGPHGTDAVGHGTGSDVVDAQHLEGGTRADDVDDGVERAHLVEVHVGGRHSMESALGFGQCPHGGQGPALHAIG